MAINQELYQHNIDFFKELAPDLAEIFLKFEPEAELVTCTNGELDLSLSGNLVYGGGGVTATTRQIQDPEWKNSRLQLAPYQSDGLDRVAGEFIGTFLNKASNDGEMAFFSDQLSRRTAAHAVVFGIGFGYHLDAIAETSQCRQLILVDSNHEFLFHSLRVYDWRAFFQKHSEAGRVIRIVIGDDAAAQAMTIREYIREINVVGLEGTYIYHHYRSPGTTETEKLMMSNIQELHTGYSFFDLEMQRLSNAHKNLGSKSARVIHPSELAAHQTAWVVDGGDALKNVLTDLAENRKRVFLMATPDAMPQLLAGGVSPDMLCLMDDDFIKPVDLLKIGKTALLSPVIIDPEIVGKFKSHVHFFLGALATCAMFGDETSTLRDTGGDARVVGAAFARSQGFENVRVIGDDVNETEDLDLSKLKNLPKDFASKLLKNLPKFGAAEVKNKLKASVLVDELSELRQEIMDLSKSCETPERWIESVVWLMLPIGGDQRPRQVLATSMVRGTVLMALFASQGYLLRLREYDRFDELFKILLDPFDEMLNKMHGEAIKAINVLIKRK